MTYSFFNTWILTPAVVYSVELFANVIYDVSRGIIVQLFPFLKPHALQIRPIKDSDVLTPNWEQNESCTEPFLL